MPRSGGRTDSGAAPLAHWIFPDARQALAQVLRTRPRVVGFGEVHQKTDSARVPSAIRRFTLELLDGIAPDLSDLIVETWVTAGRCGKEERRVVAKVEQTTQRPAETENEVVTLLKRAKLRGVQPHILVVGCDEYQKLLEGGQLDHAALLGMITRHLRLKAEQVLARREREGRATGRPQRAIALYGGALHNDLFPHPDLAAFTYAARVRKVTRGSFVEVDLYVPELIDGDRFLAREPWFPLFRRLARPDRVLLFQRGAGSYVLVFPRAAASGPAHKKRGPGR